MRKGSKFAAFVALALAFAFVSCQNDALSGAFDITMLKTSLETSTEPISLYEPKVSSRGVLFQWDVIRDDGTVYVERKLENGDWLFIGEAKYTDRYFADRVTKTNHLVAEKTYTYRFTNILDGRKGSPVEKSIKFETIANKGAKIDITPNKDDFSATLTLDSDATGDKNKGS